MNTLRPTGGPGAELLRSRRRGPVGRLCTRLLVPAAATAALVAMVAGAPVALDAQVGERQLDRGQLERRVMMQFQQSVRRELALDSATAVALFEEVDAMSDERSALQRREAALGRQLRGTGVYLSETQSIEALEEFIAIKREEVRLLEVEQERLGAILSPPQLLRFYTLREELGQRIRRLRQGVNSRGGGGLFPSGGRGPTPEDGDELLPTAWDGLISPGQGAVLPE